MRPTVFAALLLAVAAGGALVWYSQQDADAPDDASILPPDDVPKRAPIERSEAPIAPAPSSHGLPRILPPDAAIEDIRDALALTDAKARAQALGAAYASIGRIAQQPRILKALQHYARNVEDQHVRGVTWAALGANRDGSAHAWLARLVSEGPTLQDRVGALLGLAYDPRAPTVPARSLGGLPHRRATLPERIDVRDALASVFLALGDAPADALLDVVPMLEATLAASPAFYGEQAGAVAALRARLKR